MNGMLRQVVQPAEIMSVVQRARWPRTLAVLAAASVVVAGVVWGLLSLFWPVTPVHVHVRWKPDVTDAQRVELERQYQLTEPSPIDGNSWEYQLADASTTNIRTIVQDGRVDDTEHLNRIRYRPEFAQDRSRQILLYSAAAGAMGSVLMLVAAVGLRRATWPGVRWSELIIATPQKPIAAGAPNYSRRVTAAVAMSGVLIAAAMTFLAGATFPAATIALLIVYAWGYVAGSLLLRRVDGEFGPAWAIVRTIAGLLLTTISFLLSLVLSLPWFLGPAAVLVAAVWVRGPAAFAWPHGGLKFRWDGAGAAIAAAVLLSPIAITFFYMAPGSFPPVFYNIDTAYFLEKVHGLTAAISYPPESLSNVGVRRTYHYGTQAMAALISRSSGLLPHHSLFLIVLPLLTGGMVTAAVLVARYVAPALPRSVAVPLLLLSTPSLASTFWGTFGPQLWTAVLSRNFSIAALLGDYRVWGILSNEGQNIGGDFLTLSSIAALAAAPLWGWTLGAFLVGAAILVKTPVGIALIAGFVLAEAWRALVARRLPLSPQMLAAVGVFFATFVAFFVVRLESNFRVELFPFFHVLDIVERGNVPGVALDVLWLFLPVIIVMSAGITDPQKRSAPLLLMGLAPVLVVNSTRMDNIIAGGGGTGGDWLQILHPVPFLLHAFALSIASCRWDRLGPRRRVATLLAIVLATVPVAVAAARYSVLLLSNPESGSEYADNRSLAEALAVIPTEGTIVVTNDLRYPAQNFTRDYRQMQIPALFGHQAFAVNYAHEAVEERRPLQNLLQQTTWTDAIGEAAAAHHWTHLVIRKDYVYPVPIPLERVFENASYAVFRFQ
jgi:hypothetical protein